MKKLIVGLAAMFLGARAHAGLYYNLVQLTSSSTLRVGYRGLDDNRYVFVSSGAAVVKSTSATSGYQPFVVRDYAGAELLGVAQGTGYVTATRFVGPITGDVTGNVTGAILGIGGALWLGNMQMGSVGADTPKIYDVRRVETKQLEVVYGIAAATGAYTGAVSAGSFVGPLTGNATTATALAANGANCGAGNYPLGVDASGAVEGCTAAGVGDVTKAASNAFVTAATEQLHQSSFTVRGARIDLTTAYPAGWVYYRQEISSVTTAFFVGSSNNPAVPHDDTQPQLSTEGMLVLTSTMTNQVAVSTVVVPASLQACEASNSADYGVACLYVDAVQNPLCCVSWRFPTEQGLKTLQPSCKYFPNDTASHVYSARVGLNVANIMQLNGCGAAREYGGAIQSSLTVREMAAAP